MVTTAAVFLMVPVVGLAIDAGFLYAVRARLSASTDAAAVAAARSLSRGLSLGEQETSARDRARAFFDANFPDGFFNSFDKQVTVTVSETGYRTRTVLVQSEVDVGLFFMRLLGFEASTVRSEGRASRRDINMILVLDRSSSMNASASCAPMRQAAYSFADFFANGRDRLGLITYGATYFRAFPPSKDFKTGSPSMLDQINAITCSGNTSTAMALMEAYEDLQAINEPGVLNLIVLFTDGLPNGVTAFYPVKRFTDTRYGYGKDGYSSKSTQYNMEPSPCKDAEGDRYDRNAGQSSRTYSGPGWNPNWSPADKFGVLAQWSGFASTGTTAALINTEAISISNSNEVPIANKNGCRFDTSFTGLSPDEAIKGKLDYSRRDVAYIPDQDFYGNSTHGYKPFAAADLFPAGHPYEGHIRPDKPSTVGIASFNAADNAAQQIRDDDTLNPVIYAIGLGDPDSTEPPDEELMKRISNDPASPIYDETEPEGLYVFAPDNRQLAQAFYRVASEILRISQ